MTVFADTNWLEALYVVAERKDEAASARGSLVERRMRRLAGPLGTSQVVLLEARNVFSRITREPRPAAWLRLEADMSGRIFVPPMDWDALRREMIRITEKFSHKATIGTLDMAVAASACLAGARELLTFDENMKALAIALGMEVFPPPQSEGRSFLARLKRVG